MRFARWTSHVLVAAAGAVLALGVPGPAAAAPGDAGDVLARQLAAVDIPGGAVVTVTADGVVRPQPVGTTADGRSVTAQTPFVIGSTSKSFTALAVMQLVERGAVELDAPATGYVPELELATGEPVDDITVRHLLQHTSGLDDLAGGPVLASGREGPALEAVAELAGSQLASHPGETWRYANVNYVLAGLVVERASGQPYADYLEQHVLEPLGMSDTYVLADPAVAPGHRYWFGLPVSSGPVQREGIVAAGFIASSAQDMGDYLAMYLRGGVASDGTRLLSTAGVRALTAPGPEAHLGAWAGGAEARYAMGWMVGGPWEERAVFHPGNAPDSSAMIALFPDRGLAAATLVPAGHEVPVPGNPSLTDTISRTTLHSVLDDPVPGATGQWGFYLWFDAAAVALLAVASWRLARAARATSRRRPSGVRRWLLPLPALATAAVLMALPALTAYGWSGLWTWAPDLALIILLLAAMAAATGALRLVAGVRARHHTRPPVGVADESSSAQRAVLEA